MAARLVEKTHLSTKGLLRQVKKNFKCVSEPIVGRQGECKKITIEDCLMSALAMFKLKFPSLLKFEEAKIEEPRGTNLLNLFGINRAPCDTYMRERLDVIDPKELRSAFTTIFAHLQRGKYLEKFSFLGKYLMASDGTGFFSSSKVRCQNCCEKHHRNGSITYYHQMLGAAFIHPDLKEVIPICPEPIMKTDGNKKNDCERNATERLLNDFRREHPHLPVILVEDALAANGPHLNLLKDLNINHITVVKTDGNKTLFEWIKGIELEEIFFAREDCKNPKKSKQHHFRFINKIPLNDSHENLEVNFLEYHELDINGKQTYHNTWVTDIPITKQNVFEIARGGRARWKIENETFNTLKNQGYNFEHNYGHGNKNLSTVLGVLMILAFLIDQSEQLCCGLFQGAYNKLNCRKSTLWHNIRSLFDCYIIISWEVLYKSIIYGFKRAKLDTS